MEAKDRIVKTTEENCHNTLEERLAEQDRVSFKAGMQKVVGWMEQERQRHTDQQLKKSFEEVLHHYYSHKDITIHE